MIDEFDFKEEKKKRSFKLGSALWNCAALFFFLAAIAAGSFIVLLALNPQSALNPLPPAVATATNAPTNTPTITPTPEVTPTPTFTSTPEPPTATSTPDEPGGTFGMQEGSPSAVDSTIFHPELACSFMGVAGQAFGLDGAPIPGLQVEIIGTLNGEELNKLAVTGAATQYGTGEYYEVQLADEPLASDSALGVTLYDEAGQPISDTFTFSTTASCQENLIFINFVELED